MGAAENVVKFEVLRHFATREELRLWPAPAGVALTPDGKRVIKFGIPGQADLSGIIRVAPCRGTRLEIETKTAVGRQSDQQRKFQAMIEDAGGIYVLARSVNDVYGALAVAGVNLPLLVTGGAM